MMVLKDLIEQCLKKKNKSSWVLKATALNQIMKLLSVVAFLKSFKKWFKKKKSKTISENACSLIR